MFTGIITDIGEVLSYESRGDDVRMVIGTRYEMDDVAIGASIACDGVCLTVVEKDVHQFTVDVSKESIDCTHIGSWKQGKKLNLERALKVGDELGGHIVSGHVDGLGKVLSINSVSDCFIIKFLCPDALKFLVAPKGSITINGVSLTVNQVEDAEFTVNIIPHTWQHTDFQYLQEGDEVHLEVDMLARYIARYHQAKVG